MLGVTRSRAPLDPRDHARALLASLGASAAVPECTSPASPAELWARSGAMALTGFADGPPLAAPGPLASCAEGALRALRALAPQAPLPSDGAALLGERAALPRPRAAAVASRPAEPAGCCAPPTAGSRSTSRATDDRGSAAGVARARASPATSWSAVEREVARAPTAELLERACLARRSPVAAGRSRRPPLRRAGCTRSGCGAALAGGAGARPAGARSLLAVGGTAVRRAARRGAERGW